MNWQDSDSNSRDKDNQRLYEQRKQHAQQATSKGAPQKPPPPGPFCRRCKQPHSPALCPQQQSANNQPKKDSTAAASGDSSKTNSPRLGTVSSISCGARPDGSLRSCSYLPGAHNVIPHQLMVPVSISSWLGMAVLDTGSSNTLISEPLWERIRRLTPNCMPGSKVRSISPVDRRSNPLDSLSSRSLCTTKAELYSQ